MKTSTKKRPMNFTGMQQIDVPQGRNGKHKEIVTRILSDLDQIDDGVAQGAAGGPGRQQGESAIGTEPRDPQRRAERRDGQRRHLPLRLERTRP